MDKLKKVCGIILVAFFLFIIIGECILTFLPVNVDVELKGAGINSDPPKMWKKEVYDGKYQSKLADYYLGTFPLRGAYIKSYNQVKYSVFSKAGTERYIVGDEHIYEINYVSNLLHYNTTDAYLKKIESYDEYAKNLKIIQDKLISMDKSFIYLITPNKAEVFTEEIPKAYRLNNQSDIYPSTREALVEAFDKYGVYYYDSLDTAQKVYEEGEYDPFYTTSIHWNNYTATRTVQDMFAYYNDIYNANLPIPEIVSVTPSNTPKGEYSLDMYNMLNVWHAQKDDEYYRVDVNYNIEDDFVSPSILRFGTSFEYSLTYAFDYQAVFVQQEYYRYLKSKNEVLQNREKVEGYLGNKIENLDIPTMVANNDIFLVESVANVLSKSHMIFAEALAEYLTDISKEDIN